MTFNIHPTQITPSQKFDTNTDKLAHLSDESYILYEDLQKTLKVMRKMGIPSIGNPVLKLENKVLTLVYRAMQHQINCELYATLIADEFLSKDLQLQLDCLYEITDNLFNEYLNYLTSCKKIMCQHNEKIIKLNKLPITA